MSQELVKVTAPKALSIPQEEAAAVQEAFAINIVGGEVSEFDLPRIKVMSGAALWLIPSLEGDETAPRIEGVIVFSRDTRVYYTSKEAGNVPPDCSSVDGIAGRCAAGDQCRRRVRACPLASGSPHRTAGAAGLQAGEAVVLPARRFDVPRGRLAAAHQRESGAPVPGEARDAGHPVLRRHRGIELEKAQNAAGKPYGRAIMKFLRRLAPDEQQRAVEFHQMCGQFAGRLQTTAADAAAE